MENYIPTDKKRFKEGFSIIENQVLHSKAFCSLSGTAVKVYLLLRTKARLPTTSERRKLKRAGKSCSMAILNNGSLELPYNEIIELLGISRPTISKAFQGLEKVGLVDVTLAGGLYRRSLYAFSTRWMKYGTLEFEKIAVKRCVSQAGVDALRRMHEEIKTKKATTKEGKQLQRKRPHPMVIN